MEKNNRTAIHILIYILCGVWIAMAAGCEADNESVCRSEISLVTGKQCALFATNTSVGQDFLLSEGATLSFFASGGLIAHGETFTLQGNVWKGKSSLEWEPDGGKALIGVLSPAMASSVADYYLPNGELTDVLYDQKECAPGAGISLNFKHLFAKIEFRISAAANADIDWITFTPTQAVEDIRMPEARIVLSDAGLRSVTFARQVDGKYTLIVPPSADMGINIVIHTTGGEVKQAQLANRLFAQGHAYYCQIRKENEKGIYTVEDFIAFSRLINKKEYQGRSLEEFGSMENGLMTYRLKSDLQFSEEQSKLVYLIGYVSSAGFDGCFDGENHTLSGLTLTPQGTSRYPGLFTGIASAGIVRNLQVDNFCYTHASGKDYAGIFCGINKGTIHNCHVRNSIIKKSGSLTVETNFGGVIGINQGLLCNSSCTGTTFEAKQKSYAAGLVMVCNGGGKIVNCYVANCRFKAKGSGNYSSSIACECKEESRVYNCYSAGNLHETADKTCIGKLSKSTVQNCFYNDTNIQATKSDNTGNTIDRLQKFTGADIGSIKNFLNEWISTSGAALFPGQPFFPWQEAEDIPLIFIAH